MKPSDELLRRVREGSAPVVIVVDHVRPRPFRRSRWGLMPTAIALSLLVILVLLGGVLAVLEVVR